MMRVNQYQARLGHCVKWHSIYYGGGLGGETLVILEYAHAGGREAAAALPVQKGLRLKPLPPRHGCSMPVVLRPADTPLSVGAARRHQNTCFVLPAPTFL